MRLTKRQLKRIIREEYTRLKKRGLINEFGSTRRGEKMNAFHRGGDRSAHAEMESVCGGNADVMYCFDHVMNDMKNGSSPENCAMGLEGQPWMIEWDEMMSCLADCANPKCQELLNYCLDVEGMLY